MTRPSASNSHSMRSSLRSKPRRRNGNVSSGSAGTTGALGFWLANYQDMLFSKEANEICAEFLRSAIREIGQDPMIAETLIPEDLPLRHQAPPLDTDYYETFNRPNVTLVDAAQRHRSATITPKRDRDRDSANIRARHDRLRHRFRRDDRRAAAIDIRGRGGLSLADKWSEGPHTYLGWRRRASRTCSPSPAPAAPRC